MKNIYFERAQKHHKCPYCNNEVTTIFLGELFGENTIRFRNMVKEENLKIVNLGIFFDDDRDPAYICYDCNKSFDENMKCIEYIEDCLIMQTGCILKKDCKNYAALKNKYSNYKIKDISICKECKHYK